MKGVNLLPWREEKCRALKRQFSFAVASAIAIALLCLLMGHTFIASKIQTQININHYLKTQIAQLNQQIAEINALKTKMNHFIKHIQLIQKLQTNRVQIVKFYNQLVNVMPRGVYLSSAKRHDNKIIIIGKAQSNIKITELMHNIEMDHEFANPVLKEIKTNGKDNVYRQDFELQFKQITRP